MVGGRGIIFVSKRKQFGIWGEVASRDNCGELIGGREIVGLQINIF